MRDGDFSVTHRGLLNPPGSFIVRLVLEGRRIASGASRGRKVRTPPGAMPRNSGFAGDTRGGKVERLFNGKCHRKLNRPRFARSAGKGEKVRQERTARSASDAARKTPSGARPNRKPLGAARSSVAQANGFRVLAAETNDSLRPQGRRQKSAYSPSKTILISRARRFPPKRT